MSKNKVSKTHPPKDQDADHVRAPSEQLGAEERSPENDPAVERGERIATGKAIARGGQAKGPVPGATPQDSSNQ